MECPKCKLINAPAAERCDCGFSFVDGSSITVEPPGQRLRRIGGALGLGGLLTSILVRLISGGRPSTAWLLVGALGDLRMFVAVLGLGLWIVGTVRKNAGRGRV